MPDRFRLTLPRPLVDQIAEADREIEQAVRALSAARQRKRDLLRALRDREDVQIYIPDSTTEMKS